MARRVLLYLMNTKDAAASVRPLVRLLRRGGHEVVVVQPWSVDDIPVALIREGARWIALASGGPDTLPRWSAREHDDLGAAPLDVARVQAHSALAEGFPVDRERLYLDSMWSARLRGHAHAFADVLASVRPDVAIVHQGSETFARIALSRCLAAEVPVLLWETPFLPGHVLLDAGMHFLPGHSLLGPWWADGSTGDDAGAALSRWRAARTSKYAQSTGSTEAGLLAEARARDERILVVPGQVSWDANVFYGLGDHASLKAQMSAYVEAVPAGWIVVEKPHPKAPLDERETGWVDGQRLVLREVDVHALIDAADAVLVHSSNVGMEALWSGRPVLVVGQPHYRGLGLTIDLDAPAALPDALAQSTSFTPDEGALRRHFDLVAHRYLVPDDDVAALDARLALATTDLGTDVAAPFAALLPEVAEAWATLAHAYTALCRENLSPDELRDDERLAPFRERFGNAVGMDATQGARLHSGERQVATDLSDVASDHVARYRIAATQVRPGDRVLDFSCGTGYGTAVLAGVEGATALGIDCSREAIAFATSQWGSDRCRFEVASAGSFAPPDEPFDVIATFETVEHLPSDAAFLARLWDVLAPGGRLLLSVPHAAGYTLRDNPYHVRHYLPEDVDALLATLPDRAETRVFAQVDDEHIADQRDGRFLLAAVRKAGGVDAPLDLPLPYRAPPPPPRTEWAIAATALHVHDERQRAGDEILYSERMRARLGTRSRVACFGPYLDLPPGRYEATVRVRADGATLPWRRARARLIVRSDAARVVHATRDVVLATQEDATVVVPFVLEDRAPGLETIVELRRGALRIAGVRIERVEA